MDSVEDSGGFDLEGFMSAVNKPNGQWTARERSAVRVVGRMAENMTPSQRREQEISFAYGNVAIENPEVTEEMVERAYDGVML